MISNINVSVILAIVFMPLIYLAFLGIDVGLFKQNSIGLTDVFTSKKLLNSFKLSLVVSILSTLIGVFTSLLYYHIKNKSISKLLLLMLLFLFAIAPMIYSSVFSEIEIFSLLNPFFKSVIVLSIWLFPLASGIMILMMGHIDESSLVSSKFLAIPKLVLFKTIILRQNYFAIFCTAILIFMMAFVQEDVPSFFGYRTYPEEFLSRIILMERFESILIYTFPFIIFSMLSSTTLYFILKKNRWSLMQNQTTQLKNLNLISSNIFLYSIFLFFCFFVFFLIIELIIKVDFSMFTTLLSENYSVFLNSLLLSLFASFIATFLSLYLVNYFTNNIILLIAFLSIYWFLPSSLTALTLLKFSQFYYIDSEIYEYFMLLYGYVLRVLPIGLVIAFILSQHTSHSHLLKLLNIAKKSIFFSIILPIQYKKWFMVFVILFFLLLNEITTTVLLVPAGFETIIVKIYNLMHYGDFATVAFLSLLQISLILFGLLIFAKLRGFYDKT